MMLSFSAQPTVGAGEAAERDVSGQTGYLYGLRDGKIVRVELYRSPAEALQAAGTRE